MKKLFLVLAVLMAVSMTAGTAMAVPFLDGGTALQGVLDGITTAPNPGVSSVDVTTDFMSDSLDSYWDITGTGGSVATMIIELAGFAPNNIFGVYDSADHTNSQVLFAGSATAGAMVMLAIADTGEVFVNSAATGVTFGGENFGYYLDSSYYGNGGLWYSDTGLNSDGMDHMAAYQGTNTDTVKLPGWDPGLWTSNEYALAFEDLKAVDDLGNVITDGDFTDMVVMVESVQPIPEPATLFLLGSGLVGLAGIGRKKIKRS